MTQKHIEFTNAQEHEHTTYPVYAQNLATGPQGSIYNHSRAYHSRLNVMDHGTEQDALSWQYDGRPARPEAMQHAAPYREVFSTMCSRIRKLTSCRLSEQPESSQATRDWQGSSADSRPGHNSWVAQNANRVSPPPLTIPTTDTEYAGKQSSTHSPTTDNTSTHVRTCIGTINTTDNPKRFAFECIDTGCGSRSFGRIHNLARHYQADHAAERPAFWCTVSGCNRSRGGSGQPFKRKDGMIDHRRRIHGIR